MQWISQYQLFLFDFDGLLADTERLHYQAYLNMCAQRGFQLNWSFHRYSEAAHHKSTDLRDQIYAEFPDLKAQEPDWQVLYEEKKHFFLELIEHGTVPLLPGVADLLFALQKMQIKRCVVTHSPTSLIKRIRQQNPVLDTIPHWITREDYTHPKPHPECYQLAIAKYAQPYDRIIGFEDSPRGLQALIETNAKSVLICPPDSPYLEKTLHLHPHVRYYPNFNAIHDQNFPPDK
ncbi:MAG: HAD family phosphatase [Proteobacteria bacterium]|nr:HAD family phosphatase [Pseudomonadota bacterium]